MAARTVKKLMQEKREAQKILASLGALLDGIAGNSCAAELSLQDSGKDNDDGNQGEQDGPRSRGRDPGRHPGV